MIRPITIAQKVILGAIVALALSGCSPPVLQPPQFVPPLAGRLVHESFVVKLQSVSANECVLMPHGSATILLPHRLLEELSAATPSEWKTEEERRALIAGRRSNLILNSLDPEEDSVGCRRINVFLSNSNLYRPGIADTLNLVGELLQSGQAGVIENSTGELVKQIIVTYQGLGKGIRGDVAYSFRSGAWPFLVTTWWIS